MKFGNTESRYGVVAQTLHWATVLLLLVMFPLGWYMADLPIGPEKVRLYNLHKSIGVTVLVLTLLRLGWRMANPPPPLPAAMASWERLAARASHGLLYTLILAQPVIGLIHTWAAKFPLVIFGLFTIPNPIGANDPIVEPMQDVHEAVALAILAVVLIHVAAALRHHFFLRDDVLTRMLPGRNR